MENDLILNILANPTFSAGNFKDVGLNAENTSFYTKDEYLKSPKILKAFTKEDGNFDNETFDKVYERAGAVYHNMANDSYQENLIELATFHRDNIFAPANLRRTGPDFEIVEMPNPFRNQIGTIELGRIYIGGLSADELAQNEKVLANPTEAYNPDGTINEEKAEWHDAPNESWFTDFWDTRVMAQWDEDGEHLNQQTGKVEEHKKGDLKLNSNGTFYYENLDGRDVYGRRVLNKLNTLTTDGSTWNDYDFFDSDDVKQKSIGGSILKQAALVGSMFIPYVGPWIAGLSVIHQGAGFLSTLAKMYAGSDSPTLSAIEGWVLSTNRQHAKTEYALENMWCWENFIGLVGDVMGQFKEQRFLFKEAPSIIKGRAGASEKGLQSYKSKLLKEADAATKTRQALASKPISELTKDDVLNIILDAKNNTLAAQSQLDSYIKGYNKIGEILSKSYMTALVVSDTFGEAKNSGASDEEAALLTMGYAAAEYALLNTGVGEWLFPELRYNKMRLKAIANALLENKEATVKSGLKIGSNEAKKDYVKRLFNSGVKAFKSVWSAENSTGERTLKAAIANGLGEGVEEVSEEALADFSKACFNIVNNLRGDETRTNTNWYNYETDLFTFDYGLNDYLMNFLGGVVGGAGAGLSLDNIKQFRGLNNMSFDLAFLELIYLDRNNETSSFLKTLDKMELGNKHLSAKNYTQTESGQLVWSQGTEDDNQDLAAKKAIKQQVNLIHNILNTHGLDLSDDLFLSKLISLIGDLKYEALAQSKAASRLLQEYNSLGAQLTQANLSLLNNPPETDKEKRTESEMDLIKKEVAANVKQKIDDLIKLKDDLLNGNRTLEFVQDALFEMSPIISEVFVKPTFILFAEWKENKKIDKISDNRLRELKEEYKGWEDKKDTLHIASLIYNKIMQETPLKSDVEALSKQNPLVAALNKFYLTLGLSSILSMSEDWLEDAENSVPGLNLMVIKEIFDLLNLDATPIDEAVKNDTDIPLEYIAELLVENQDKIGNAIKEQGFLNAEIKDNLYRLFNLLASKYKRTRLNEILGLYFVSSIEDRKLLLAEEQAIIKERLNFRKLANEIKELPHTPIERFLNNFSLTVSGKPLQLTELLTFVNLVLNEGKLREFNLEDTVLRQLNEASTILDIFKSVVNGARTDNFGLNNLFGYSASINQVAETLKTKDYKPLPEIDADIADAILLDIDILLDKLTFILDLYAINLGLKLTKQSRVALNTHYIIHDRAKKIISILPPKERDKLQNALDNAVTLTKYSQDRKLDLSKEDKLKIESEIIQIEDTIYDIFNNIDLKEFIRDNLVLLLKDYDDKHNKLLDENLKDFDDSSFLWWLAARTAVKSSIFHKRYASVINDEIAPIIPQELATYMNYASVVNGNIFTKFYNAARDAIKEYALSHDGSNLYLDHLFTVTNVPRYSNIVLTEGIPGSGKTTAVLNSTVEMIRKFNPELLDNTIVAHGANGKSATKLAENLKLKNAKTYSKAELMAFIRKDGTLKDKYELDIDYYDNNGEYRSRAELNVHTKYPTLMIIDEISNFDAFEIDSIDEFAKLHGITVLATGDFDLTGKEVSIPFDGLSLGIGLNHRNFIHTQKLGVSIRTANSLKNKNLVLLLNWIYNEKYVPTLRYYESDTELFGDKVIEGDLTDVEDELRATIAKMGDEKIGYIYQDDESELKKWLEENYKDKIIFYKGNEAQGQESKYFIIDPGFNDELKTNDNYDLVRKAIYTGISRSSNGSIVFLHPETLNIKLELDTNTILERFDKSAIKQFALERKLALLEITSDVTDDLKYTARTVTTILPEDKSSDDGEIPSPIPIDEEPIPEEPQHNLTPEEIQQSINDAIASTGLAVGDSFYYASNKFTVTGIINTDGIVKYILGDSEMTLEEIQQGLRNNLITKDNPGEVIENDDAVLQADIVNPDLDKQEIESEMKGFSLAKVKKEVVQSALDSVLNPAPVRHNSNGFAIKLNPVETLLYSFNTFETGCRFDENGNPIIDPQRIDSFNGLHKLGSNKSKNDYNRIIGLIRKEVKSIGDKLELAKAIGRILSREFGLTNKQFDITFAFITENLSDNQDIYGIFNKDRNNERAQFINVTSAKSESVMSSTINLVVSIDGVDSLSLPILSFENPITLANAINESAVLAKKPIPYEYQIKYTPTGQIDFYLTVLSLRLNIKNNYGIDDCLYKLCEIFILTNNVAVKLDDDWTPVKNAKNIGITTISSNRDEQYLFAEDWATTVPDIPLRTLASDPQFTVSPIMRTDTGIIEIGGVALNGGQRLINPRFPFVLVSDSNLTKAQLLPAYIRLLQDPTAEKKVLLYYVIPPTATFTHYIDTLNRVWQGLSGDTDRIGNRLTPYKIVRRILGNSEIKKIFTDSKLQSLKQSYNNVRDILIKCENLSTNERYNYLGETGISGYSREHELTRFLYELCFNRVPSTSQQDLIRRNDRIISLIDSLVDDIYYVPVKDDSIMETYGIYQILQNPNYTITTVEGKDLEYTIHATANSSSFVSDENLLTQILNNISVNGAGMQQGRDNVDYTRNRLVTGLARVNPYKDIIERFQLVESEDVNNLRQQLLEKGYPTFISKSKQLRIYKAGENLGSLKIIEGPQIEADAVKYTLSNGTKTYSIQVYQDGHAEMLDITVTDVSNSPIDVLNNVGFENVQAGIAALGQLIPAFNIEMNTPELLILNLSNVSLMRDPSKIKNRLKGKITQDELDATIELLLSMIDQKQTDNTCSARAIKLNLI